VKSPIERYGVKRWSPPGRLARKIPPKRRAPVRFSFCGYCYANHADTTTCLDAASTPDQRGWRAAR